MLQRAKQLIAKSHLTLFTTLASKSPATNNVFVLKFAKNQAPLRFFSSKNVTLLQQQKEQKHADEGEENVKRVKSEEAGDENEGDENQPKRKKNVKVYEYLITAAFFGLVGFAGYKTYDYFSKQVQLNSICS